MSNPNPSGSSNRSQPGQDANQQPYWQYPPVQDATYSHPGPSVGLTIPLQIPMQTTSGAGAPGSELPAPAPFNMHCEQIEGLPGEPPNVICSTVPVPPVAHIPSQDLSFTEPPWQQQPLVNQYWPQQLAVNQHFPVSSPQPPMQQPVQQHPTGPGTRQPDIDPMTMVWTTGKLINPTPPPTHAATPTASQMGRTPSPAAHIGSEAVRIPSQLPHDDPLTMLWTTGALPNSTPPVMPSGIHGVPDPRPQVAETPSRTPPDSLRIQVVSTTVTISSCDITGGSNPSPETVSSATQTADPDSLVAEMPDQTPPDTMPSDNMHPVPLAATSEATATADLSPQMVSSSTQTADPGSPVERASNQMPSDTMMWSAGSEPPPPATETPDATVTETRSPQSVSSSTQTAELTTPAGEASGQILSDTRPKSIVDEVPAPVTKKTSDAAVTESRNPQSVSSSTQTAEFTTPEAWEQILSETMLKSVGSVVLASPPKGSGTISTATPSPQRISTSSHSDLSSPVAEATDQSFSEAMQWSDASATPASPTETPDNSVTANPSSQAAGSTSPQPMDTSDDMPPVPVPIPVPGKRSSKTVPFEETVPKRSSKENASAANFPPAEREISVKSIAVYIDEILNIAVRRSQGRSLLKSIKTHGD